MTIGSPEWVEHNADYIRRFDGMSDRQIVEHFAVVDCIDPSMPTLFILHAIICWSMKVAVDPAVSSEALELYSRGYADGATGKPPSYDILDPSDDTEEHF